MSDLDFNLENDFLPDPLVPQGTYKGHITKTTFSDDSQCLTLSVTLDGNGGYCNDDSTDIDGSVVTMRVWYPKEGDRDTMTGSGRQTKWQWKVNQIGKVAKALGINLNTREDMKSAVDAGDWIGTEVEAKVTIEEYNGEYSNSINAIKAVE